LPNLTKDEQTLMEMWDEIYAITSFFVGTADDLTPQEYLKVTNDVFGSSFKPSVLSESSKLTQLKGELGSLRSPQRKLKECN